MRQFVADGTSTTLCDCSNSGALDLFAKQVATALAVRSEDRTTELMHQRLAGHDDPATWAKFAIDSWTDGDRDEKFVFENAESISNSVDCVEFLSRLLSRTPSSRQVIICSRVALPFAWNRFFAPHQVLVLRGEDLRFDSAELAAALGDATITRETLDRIVKITRGWPIAVLLLARLARERSLPSLTDGLHGVAFEGLYEYLSDEVMNAMPYDQLDCLLAVTAIPDARASDISAALGREIEPDQVKALARSSPFLYETEPGVYEAHPLIRSLLVERHAQRCVELVRSAAASLAPRNRLRAAQLLLIADDQDAALALLENAHQSFMSDMSPMLAEIIASVDRATLLRHPAVWQAATLVRGTAIPQKQWLEEALVVFERLTPETPARVKLGVIASLGNVLTNLGRNREARQLFETLAEEHGDLAEARALHVGFLAVIDARVGEFTRALKLWNEAEPLFAQSALTRALGSIQIVSVVFRYWGRREMERARLETAIALVRHAASPLGIALALEEAAFGAWFAGESALFDGYLAELENTIAPTSARGTEVFRHCGRGLFDALRRAEGVESPKIRCYASLIGLGFASGERVEIAIEALRAADDAGEPALSAICAVACAVADEARRLEFIERARSSVQAVDSLELRRAIESFAAGDSDLGLLAPMIGQLRAAPAVAVSPRSEGLRVSLSSCTVEWNGLLVPLSGRELQLVAYLALRRNRCRPAEILEDLWPENEKSDHSILRVYVQKVRKKLGKEAIVADRFGYGAGADTVTDLEAAESCIARAKSSPQIPSDVQGDLEAHFEHLTSGRSSVSDGWTWFGPAAVRIDDLIRELGSLLGRDALARGDVPRALLLARRIIGYDPCDEPARELSIRAYLAAGEPSSALREYRLYREILARELDARPSAALTALVSGHA